MRKITADDTGLVAHGVFPIAAMPEAKAKPALPPSNAARVGFPVREYSRLGFVPSSVC